MTRSETLAATINDALEHAQTQSGGPGFGGVVVRSTGVPALAVNGVRRVGEAALLERGDRFHIGSNAKSMTATLAAIAVDERRLEWATDVADVLPAVQRRGVSLLHLLSHTAGLPAFDGEDEIRGRTLPPLGETPAEQRAAFAVLLLERELLYEPGTSAAYTSAGYAVAAAMLEHACGESWESLLVSRLFEPLGIDGGIGWPADRDPNQPWGHFLEADGSFRPHDPRGPYQIAPLLAPAGHVNASLEGYARFLQLHLRGIRGDAELLSADAYARLHSPVLDMFAAGWVVYELDGVVTSFHSGSPNNFFAVAGIQPSRDLAVAVVANAAGEPVFSAVGAAFKACLAAG
jgi:CubicO group peptidase (beta-lactamase class C family)